MFDRLERTIYMTTMVFLAIVSIVLTSIIFKATFSREIGSQCFSKTPGWQKNFTFVNDDFPESLPDMGEVRLVVEESVRFALDRPEAEIEWLSTSPPGTGHIAMGAKNRPFFVSMFHQLHCLRRFREALTGQGSSQGHTHHCLNYLRQSTLCQADLTLEAGDFTTWDFTQRRVGATHVCRDWGALYDYVTVNWKDRQLAAMSNHTV